MKIFIFNFFYYLSCSFVLHTSYKIVQQFCIYLFFDHKIILFQKRPNTIFFPVDQDLKFSNMWGGMKSIKDMERLLRNASYEDGIRYFL